MLWIRLLIGILFFLMLVYYMLVVLQCFGILEFTEESISFKKGIIPFYYWFHSEKHLNQL